MNFKGCVPRCLKKGRKRLKSSVTPRENAFTNIISASILALEEAARNKKGVFESPSAVKIPVAIL